MTADNAEARFSTSVSGSANPASKTSTEILTTYYASLRGLNISALSALEGVIKTDAFVNLDQVLDRLRLSYNKHHKSIVKEFEANRVTLANNSSTFSNPTAPTISAFPPANQKVLQGESSQSGATQSKNTCECGFTLLGLTRAAVLIISFFLCPVEVTKDTVAMKLTTMRQNQDQPP